MAPPRKQADNRENKHFPAASGGSCLLEKASKEKTTITSPDKPSIAVLPFANLSGDPEQAYFSDGITNDLIAALSRFGDLLVIASNTVFTYKGKAVNVKEVGYDLGVRYVLEGSIQKAGDKVRINAQLIEAASGHHLWAEHYNRDLKDIFTLQNEIVQTIVTTLGGKINLAERKRAMRKDTDSLEAYDYLLRGWEHFSKRTRSANIKAKKMYQKAIERDPDYANAYVALARAYVNDMGYGWTEFPAQTLQKALDLGNKALSLNESNAGAHALLGISYVYQGEYELAFSELQRAIELNPNDAYSYSNLGLVMLYSSRTDEAIDALKSAMRFDPNVPPSAFFLLGIGYYLKEQYENAIKTLKKGLGRKPDFMDFHVALAAVYAQAGRQEDSEREAKRVRGLNPFFEVDSYGTVFRNPADRDKIIEGLRKAGLN